MILVDTSVWIDYFNGKDNACTERLDAALDQEAVAIGDLIYLEILQGFRDDDDYELARARLSRLTVYDLLGMTAADRCADNYRQLRKRGITVRKTADVIIASFCIEHQIPLLFLDRDFLPFVDHLSLQAAVSVA